MKKFIFILFEIDFLLGYVLLTRSLFGNDSDHFIQLEHHWARLLNYSDFRNIVARVKHKVISTSSHVDDHEAVSPHMPLVGSEKVGGIGCRCSTSSLFWKLVIVFCQERPENRRNCRSHSFTKPHSNFHPVFIFSSWIEDPNRACWYNEEDSVHKEWMTSHGTHSTISLLSIISFTLQVISSSWLTRLEALFCFLWCFSHHVFSSRYPRLTKWSRRS